MSTVNPTPLSTNAAWRNQLILFGALAMSSAMYGGVLFVVVGQGQAPPIPPGIFLPVYAAIGLSLLIASLVIKPRMMPLLSDETEIQPLDNEIPTQPQSAAIAKYLLANLVSWALSEGVAILGLVLALQTHDLNQFFPFVGLAAVGFALHRPQQQVLQRVLAAAKT